MKKYIEKKIGFFFYFSIYIFAMMMIYLVSILDNADSSNLVERDIFLQILLLPMFSVVVVFFRQVIGMTTFGVFAPLIIGFSFIKLGFIFSVVVYFFMFLTGFFSGKIVNQFEMLSVSKRSFNLFIISFISSLFFIFSELNNFGLEFNNIPFIMFVHILDSFNKKSQEKGYYQSLKILSQTFIVGITVFFLHENISMIFGLDSDSGKFVLSKAYWVLYLCFFLNVILAMYTGPRLTEVFRFEFFIKNKNIFKVFSGTEFLNMNSRILNFIRKHNTRSSINLVDDKVRYKNILMKNNIPTTKLITTIKSDSTKEIKKVLDNLEAPFVLKPCHGAAGKGILIIESSSSENQSQNIKKKRTKILDLNSKSKSKSIKLKPKLKTEEDFFLDIKKTKWTKSDLVKHISNTIEGQYSMLPDLVKDTCMIEEKLIPPKFFTEFSEYGLPDIRVIYFLQEPVLAMMRIPTKKSDGKANVSQGALAAHIDIETGKIIKFYSKKTGKYFDPDKEIILPQWKKLIEIGKKAVLVSGLKFGGCDIVYDRTKGPIIMECNARPGLEIQNVTKQNLYKLLKKIENQQKNKKISKNKNKNISLIDQYEKV